VKLDKQLMLKKLQKMIIHLMVTLKKANNNL
jgi:hypothetical protein